MYALGYWAEATSCSPSEQQDGVRDIEKDLLGPLEQVEKADPKVMAFFGRFPKIVVVDRASNPLFSQERLVSWLNPERVERVGGLEVRTYSPK